MIHGRLIGLGPQIHDEHGVQTSALVLEICGFRGDCVPGRLIHLFVLEGWVLLASAYCTAPGALCGVVQTEEHVRGFLQKRMEGL